jgi:hypothetical protein
MSEALNAIHRGPWSAWPLDRAGHYRITCRELPGWEFEVPASDVGDALYMLANSYKFQKENTVESK